MPDAAICVLDLAINCFFATLNGTVPCTQVLVVKVYLGASTEDSVTLGSKKPELIHRDGKVHMSALLEGPKVTADAFPGFDSVYRTRVSTPCNGCRNLGHLWMWNVLYDGHLDLHRECLGHSLEPL
jgi:hypothetical protein